MTVEQIIWAAIGAMASIIGALAIRTLRQIDANQAQLAKRLDDGLGEAFERLRAVELDLTSLQAEHHLFGFGRHNLTQGGSL